MKSHQIYFKFFRFNKPYRIIETVLIIVMIIASAGTLVSPYVLKVIIDEVIPSKDFNYLIQLLLLLVGIYTIRMLLDFYSNYLYSWVSNHIMLDIRLILFNHILHLPVAFFDKNKTGDITHRINDEVDAVQGMLTQSLIRFIWNILTVIGLSIALCFLNYKLFIVSMIVVPFVLLNAKYFQPKIHNLIRESREMDADILGFFVEKLNNIRLIKSYNRYHYENEKLNSKGHKLISKNLRTSMLTAGNQSMTTFLISLSPLIIFALGGKNVILGTMTIGSLIAFIQYLYRIFDPVNDFMYLYWDLVRTSVSMRRIFEFLELPTETTNIGLKNLNLNKCIKFTGVNFKYDKENVLQDLYLELEHGKIYAIVGTSGCGKSTIVNLLVRFYNIEKGSITFDNVNIEDMDLDELRQHITVISQENQLFHDSIYENIKYGSPDSTKKEIESVIKLTGLDDFINLLNNGADSIIGNEGAKISGGQKQRIAIARALLRNTDLIILDEATSALDSESENNIIHKALNIFKGKLIILISHRLSAIKDVDEIICLDSGHIVEKGNHKDLINLKGLYWELFKKQLE